MFCPNCGNQLSDDSKFCDSCGASIVEEPTPQPEPAPQPEPVAEPQYQQPQYQQPQYQQPQYQQQYVPQYQLRPKAPSHQGMPGLAAGIAGMAIGILLLIHALQNLVSYIDLVDSASKYYDVADSISDSTWISLIISVLASVLGLSLSCGGRYKGYRTGATITGLVTNLVALLFFLISIILLASN